MKANWKTLLLLLTLVVVFALVLTFAFRKNPGISEKDQVLENRAGVVAGSSTVEGDYIERLAKTTADKGMVLFGSFQSKDSIGQKELFGSASKYLDYVECDSAGPNANPDECISQSIDTYPTWMFEGKKYPGKMELAQLAQIIGFSE